MPITKPEDLDLLLDLWNGGTPTKIIQDRFKLTRSGVLGYINRLRSKHPDRVRSRTNHGATIGLPAPVRPPGKDAIMVKVPKKTTKGPASKPARIDPKSLPPVWASARLDGANPFIGRTKTTIFALTDRTCRWPLTDPKTGGTTYCGKRTDPAGLFPVYCTGHGDLAASATHRATALGKARLHAQRLVIKSNPERE